MPQSLNPRRVFIAAVTASTLALSASPVSAALVPVQLPCVAGVNCTPKPACANETVDPTSGNVGAMRRATLCLLNRERTKRGLGKLQANRALRGVAQKYARSMNRLNFFDHVSPAGSTFVERIKRSSYLRGFSGYNLGENLAWGGGSQATPKAIMQAWMDSPGHRANILNGEFHHVGIGVAQGLPVAGGGAGATYVNEFGTRAN